MTGVERTKIFEAPRAVLVAGPTASGKSDFALKLAKKIDGVIISADSMQIYRGLDIGTAKVSSEIRNQTPHELINIIEPNESFSVSQFATMASEVAKKAQNANKIPIVVGGTGLFFESLVRPLEFGNVSENSALRAKLSDLYDADGGQKVYKTLKEKDPVSAEKLHINDKRRIIRALEVALTTEKNISDQHSKIDLDFIMVCFGAEERAKLYERIERRVDTMMGLGLAQEASKYLIEIGENAQSMQAIGYKEFAPFIDSYKKNGCFSSEELQIISELIKKNTRNYAKRQLTWFRHYPFAKWFESGDWNGATNYILSRLGIEK